MADYVSFKFDGDSLEGLSRHMRESADLVKLETDKMVAEVGAIVTADAKLQAAGHSQSIPSTIRLEVIPGAAIIHAGNADVPLAVLYEKGNKGQRKGKTFKHPVFGDRNNWVEQPRFRFLAPALRRARPLINKKMRVALDRSLEPVERV